MLRKTIILLLLFTISSCGPGKKRRTYSKTRTVTVEGSTTDTSPKRKSKKEGSKNAKANEIVSTALTFSGTRYKYGGTTKRGMDCSGLVYVSLKENDIMFPRTSYQMALEGQKIRVSDVEKGVYSLHNLTRCAGILFTGRILEQCFCKGHAHPVACDNLILCP